MAGNLAGDGPDEAALRVVCSNLADEIPLDPPRGEAAKSPSGSGSSGLSVTVGSEAISVSSTAPHAHVLLLEGARPRGCGRLEIGGAVGGRAFDRSRGLRLPVLACMRPQRGEDRPRSAALSW